MHFDEYADSYGAGNEETKELIRQGVCTMVMREIARLSNRTYPYGAKAAAELPKYVRKTIDTSC